MKSRSTLVLLEQLLMTLVFALAAAFCLQAFALSGRISRDFVARDRAAAAAQDAAEVLKGGDFVLAAETLGGSAGADELTVCYDSDWHTGGDGVYVLTARRVAAELDGLGKAEITVSSGDVPLFTLETAWQEVARHG